MIHSIPELVNDEDRIEQRGRPKLGVDQLLELTANQSSHAASQPALARIGFAEDRLRPRWVLVCLKRKQQMSTTS